MVSRYDSTLNDDMACHIRECVDAFADNLKLALHDPEKATTSLNSLADRMRRIRERMLLQFLQGAITDIRRKLMSPLWLGAQVNALTKLDQLETSIDFSSDDFSSDTR